jgi:hypothetical protein
MYPLDPDRRAPNAPAAIFLARLIAHEPVARSISRNPFDADQISAAESLAEIAEILSAGLLRLRARQSTPLSADCRESSLDCVGHQSGHAISKTENGR